MDELLEEFRRYKLGRNAAHTTIKTYLRECRRFFKWAASRPEPLAKHHPEDITTDDILDYMYLLKVEQHQAINTQKIKQASFRMFYAWYSVKYRKPNPAKDLTPIQEEVKIPIMPTPDDLVRMVDSIGLDTPRGRRNAALICLLADTGIRLGECVLLNVGNIQLHEGNFVLIVPRFKKGSHERIVPFGRLINGDLIGEVFSAYYQEIRYKQHRVESDPLFIQDGPVHSGNRLSMGGIRNAVKSILKRNELSDRINVHSFRHFFGTYSALRGSDIRKIQKLMGHAWLETTERYIHIAESLEPDTIDKRGTTGLKAPERITGFSKISREINKQIPPKTE